MTEPNPWRRSTFCESGACIEVRKVGDGIWIRTSRRGPVFVVVTPAEFAAFVAGAKAGEFDDLAGGV